MMALVKDAFGKERVPARSYTPPAKPASGGGAPVYRPSAPSRGASAPSRGASAPSRGASAGYTPPASQPAPAPAYTPPPTHADIIEQRAEQFRLASAKRAAQKSEVLANMRVRQQQAREDAAAEKAQSWRASGARGNAEEIGALLREYVPLLSERMEISRKLEQ